MSLYKGSQLISGAMPNSANQSLSNLNSAGQDKFDAKANTSLSNLTSTSSTNFDGQWKTTTFYVIANTSITGATDLPYSLASYLPSDNYNYEVLIRATTNTNSTSGSTTIAYVNSSLITNWIGVAGGQTRTNASVLNYGSCIIPVSSNKTIYLHRESAYTGTVQLILLAYRRIGTNS